ncbi:MAG: carbohydrate-binding domain-containing protein [Fibromonadaceae bacterium]|jgi:hypothetical protein|nr:carbohydrate-binding domain-containing protein [Fibromonadaceae bacterium]
MLQLRFSPLFSFAITLALAVFLSCSSGGDNPDNNPNGPSGGGSCGGVDDGWPFDSSGEELEPSPSLESLMEQEDDIHHFSKVIYIKYKNGSDPEIDNDYEYDGVNISYVGENVTVMMRNGIGIYSFVLSGTTSNGSLLFTEDNNRKELYLNGVSITSSKGPAINHQGNRHVLVHLVNGKSNYLADGSNYKCSNFEENEQQAKGAFFSEGKLEFEGSGSLEVKGKCNHAIAIDEDFEINNGKITISESVKDGIHANKIVKVKGGILDIKSTGDAIQNEKDSIKIVGGKIKALTTGIKSHGIVNDSMGILIDGDAIVQISVKGNGSKGIKSAMWAELKGGKTSIKVNGTKHIDPADPEDESTPAGIKLADKLSIKGGELTIKSPGCKAKGMNIASGTISAGNTNIEADDDGIKVQPQGKLQITGGTVYIKSAKKKAIDGEKDETGGNVTLIDGGF